MKEEMKNPVFEKKDGDGFDSSRVSRGGGWDEIPRYEHVSYRNSYAPSYHYHDVGFRIVKNTPNNKM